VQRRRAARSAHTPLALRIKAARPAPLSPSCGRRLLSARAAGRSGQRTQRPSSSIAAAAGAVSCGGRDPLFPNAPDAPASSGWKAPSSEETTLQTSSCMQSPAASRPRLRSAASSSARESRTRIRHATCSCAGGERRARSVAGTAPWLPSAFCSSCALPTRLRACSAGS
jgi:hypothetical protein